MLVSWVNPSGGEFWEDHRLVDGFVGVFMVVRSSIDEDVGAVNSQPRALPFTSRRAVNLSGDGIPRGCCQGAPAGLPLASRWPPRWLQGAFAGGAQTVEWMSKTRAPGPIPGDRGTMPTSPLLLEYVRETANR